MKVVGLSGAQGAGKSTLLKALLAKGWELDSFRVSRAVQEQLGWSSLDVIKTSPLLMMEFQEEVFQQKYRRDLGLQTNPAVSLILTERTFADLAAYTSNWVWDLVYGDKLALYAGMEWLSVYISKCARAQNEIYSGVMLLPYMDHVVWEADPNRAARSSVDLIMADIDRFIEQKMPITSRVMRLSQKTVNDRATEADNFLRTL